jgi:pimeloyl-ACP methyl ester carboxylesterase
MTRTERSAQALDALIREAEFRTYAHYGLTPAEKIVVVETAQGSVPVRLSIFGSSDGEKPTILFLHGIASVSALAAPLLPYLGDRHVVAVDWPGHGLSGGCVLPAGANVRAHATGVLRSLLDDLELAQVDVVGHSMGAQFGLYAALDLDHRIRRLVLLGAPGAGLIGVKPVLAMKLLAVPALGRMLLSLPMSRRTFVRTNEKMLGSGALADVPADLVTAGMLIARRHSYLVSVPSYFRSLIRRGRVRQQVPVRPAGLTRLSPPTLLVWGDADVFLEPTDAAESIDAMPDSRLISVPGAGHAPWLHDTVTVGRAVAEHLSQ